MMRKPLMIANWKMNKTRDDALAFIYAVNDSLPSNEFVDTVICAPTIILRDLVKRQGDTLKIGAQNVFYEESGAYTGEISPVMLTSTGVEYVIVGHSERRSIFHETDEDVNKKVLACLKHGLKPILCIGETLEERENDKTLEVLESQITKDLKGVSPEMMENVIIAYEPIWAIGTGKTATAKMANEACSFVRELVKKLYNAAVSEETRILYGGSMKPANAKELLNEPDIDGGLVGGASLDPESFLELVKDCTL